MLLDLTGVPGMDLTAVSVAREFYGLVRQHGIDLWIALDSLQPLELLGRMGIGGWLSDRGRLHPDVEAAVTAYRARGS
ncbi:STAS domain-containing protein [Streptosporangium sp. NPDC002607]